MGEPIQRSELNEIETKPVSECLAEVNTPVGRERLKKYLDSLPFPHYEPLADRPGYYVRIEADGKRTTGRFVGRQFEEISASSNPREL